MGLLGTYLWKLSFIAVG